MSLNLYDTTIVPIKLLLSNLSVLLQKAEQHATDNKLPETHFTEGKLAPDMLALPKQIIIACNTAKFIPVRVAAHENEVVEDNQQTITEMRDRIAATIKYLDGVKREEFDTPDVLTKEIKVGEFRFQGGVDYVNQYAMPNFYFHVVTAYDILRAQGLQIGKMDYLFAAKRAAAPAA